MKYKCIIFDCDGVLVDSEEISSSVLVNMSKEIGAEINLDYANENFTGKSLKSCFEHIEKLVGSPLPNEFEKDYRDRTFNAFKTDLKPIEGIHELLDKIPVPYCTASNGPLDKMKLNLEITNLMDKFEGWMFSAYEIGKWKPDPALFEHAAKEMGYKPKECAVVEDSMAGIVAAKRGGFDVFGFANERNKDAFEKEGAKVFFEMGELRGLLNF